MSAPQRKSTPLERRRASPRKPRPKIVIICEGKITEPEYFRRFRRLHGSTLVDIDVIGPAGVPSSVVQRACQEKDRLIDEARKSRDSFDLIFEVWAVFDRDEHPKNKLAEAFQLADIRGINIAFSNPCFEVWGLMHFECWNRPGHHHETQSTLKEKLHGYCHEDNPIIDPQDLKLLYDDAVRNANSSLRRRTEEGIPRGDPSTNVQELTERIRANGRQ